MGYVESTLEDGVDNPFPEWGRRDIWDRFTREVTYQLNFGPKSEFQHTLRVEKGIPGRLKAEARAHGADV